MGIELTSSLKTPVTGVLGSTYKPVSVAMHAKAQDASPKLQQGYPSAEPGKPANTMRALLVYPAEGEYMSTFFTSRKLLQAWNPCTYPSKCKKQYYIKTLFTCMQCSNG